VSERLRQFDRRRQRTVLRILAGGLPALCAAGAAHADPPYPPFLIDAEPSVFDLGQLEPKAQLKGTLSLGGVRATGSSSNTSGNGKFELKYRYARWHNRLKLSALYGSQDGNTTARRYAGSDTLRYYLTSRRFLFTNLAGLQDRFAGYDYQFSETAGYGWRVLHGGAQGLDLEVGAGLAQAQEVDGPRRNAGVARIAAHYRYRLSDHSKFSQTVEVFADHNTYTQAATSLDVSVYGNIGLQLSYTVTHNTQTPSDVPKTTTITSINLLYNF
jgi:putative salt-induced outer membrane protein